VRSTIKATATSPSVAAISQAPSEEPFPLPPFILLIGISAKVIAFDAHLFLFLWCICSRRTSVQTPTRLSDPRTQSVRYGGDLARPPLGREFDQVVHVGLSLRHGLADFEAEQKLLQIVSNGKAMHFLGASSLLSCSTAWAPLADGRLKTISTRRIAAIRTAASRTEKATRPSQRPTAVKIPGNPTGLTRRKT
jgi:hypothetical protein